MIPRLDEPKASSSSEKSTVPEYCQSEVQHWRRSHYHVLVFNASNPTATAFWLTASVACAIFAV